MKRFSLLAALLLVLGLLAGCGSSDSDADGGSGSGGGVADAPKNASVEDFCGAFMDLIEQATQPGAELSDADQVKLAKDLSKKLQEIGTPEDMPADARKGFEKALQLIDDLSEDATPEEMEKASGSLTEEEQANQSALSDYISKKCLGSLLPSASPSS